MLAVVLVAPVVVAVTSKISSSFINNVKLLQQLQDLPLNITPVHKVRNNSIKNIPEFLKEVDLRSLFAGVSVDIIRYFPNKAFTYALTDAFTNWLDKKSPLHPIIGAALAGACTTLLLHPLDVLQTRFSYDKISGINLYSGYFNCMAQNGFSGLYSGLPASLLGNMIYKGVLFPGLRLQKYLPAIQSRTMYFTFAQLIGMLAVTLSYPLDTVRRYQMINGDGLIESFQKIYQSNGLPGFYNGLYTNFVRSVSAAVIIVIMQFGVDALMCLLNKEDDEDIDKK
eukprot:TRINITY_DN10707_c0_g1_i1.p1 TRINITY_DN10707_c0_g1~~TRINITY_DN10707_c0_g1_i1.p1  ORF type:complete len:282 (-),score=31.61 TRINITY_DN10707_c0_g1_i1:65-910(-)